MEAARTPRRPGSGRGVETGQLSEGPRCPLTSSPCGCRPSPASPAGLWGRRMGSIPRDPLPLEGIIQARGSKHFCRQAGCCSTAQGARVGGTRGFRASPRLPPPGGRTPHCWPVSPPLPFSIPPTTSPLLLTGCPTLGLGSGHDPEAPRLTRLGPSSVGRPPEMLPLRPPPHSTKEKKNCQSENNPTGLMSATSNGPI